MTGFPFGQDIMFTVFPVLIFVVLAAVLGVMLFVIVKTLSRHAMNRNAPILSVDARIVGKREQTSGGGETMAWTHYYVTFEVASGDRMEFQVEGRESGMLAEGDKGKLTFQGTRYMSFLRVGREQ